MYEWWILLFFNLHWRHHLPVGDLHIWSYNCEACFQNEPRRLITDHQSDGLITMIEILPRWWFYRYVWGHSAHTRLCEGVFFTSIHGQLWEWKENTCKCDDWDLQSRIRRLHSFTNLMRRIHISVFVHTHTHTHILESTQSCMHLASAVVTSENESEE